MKTIITFIVVFCFLQQKCFCLTDNEIAQFKSRSFINKNSGVQVRIFYEKKFFLNIILYLIDWL